MFFFWMYIFQDWKDFYFFSVSNLVGSLKNLGKTSSDSRIPSKPTSTTTKYVPINIYKFEKNWITFTWSTKINKKDFII